MTIRYVRKRSSYRWFLIMLLGALVALATISCREEAPPPRTETEFSPSFTERVRYVIDGDTVVLENGEKIRLLGINTPEIRKPYQGGYQGVEQPWGRDAANYLKVLLEGQEVGVEYDSIKTDKYGRSLAYVFLENEMINARILREGYGPFMGYGHILKYH